jgi:hypothetical protein
MPGRPQYRVNAGDFHATDKPMPVSSDYASGSTSCRLCGCIIPRGQSVLRLIFGKIAHFHLECIRK